MVTERESPAHQSHMTYKKSPSAKNVKIKGTPFDFWPKNNPAVIAKNNFKYKSLSNWACNFSVGCSHACRFCYVPSVSTIKKSPELAEFGVIDPDKEWGNYSLLRHWNEKAFLASLKSAQNTHKSKLKKDGNRAILFCSTTDPYQTFKGSTPEKTILLQSSSLALVRKALEAIRDHSNLNVRILTRSPLAKKDFNLFKTFGNRLVFGMSLPTLNNKLSTIYEPKAPAPNQRLKTLQEAKEAGLHVFVAVAPTYPECDEEDLRVTLAAIKKIDPITIFHEPINIRAENVKRIEERAKELKVKLNTSVFATREAWLRYALDSLLLMQQVATDMGMQDHLHLWPDKQLKSKAKFLKALKQERADLQLTRHQQKQAHDYDERHYHKSYEPWIHRWWSRVSEWPHK